jgi:hypothetical protein
MIMTITKRKKKKKKKKKKIKFICLKEKEIFIMKAFMRKYKNKIMKKVEIFLFNFFKKSSLY